MARRTWVRRVGLVLVLAVGAAGTWAGVNATALRVRYAAHKFATAATDEERAGWADNLAARGDAGLPKLVEFIRAGDPTLCPAAAAAVERHLAGLPDDDPRAVTLGGQVLDAFPGGDATPAAVLDLLPAVLKRSGLAHAVTCRQVVAAGLKLPSPAARLTAVRLALHPHVTMRADLVPLLAAPEPEVRRAALFAVGPATDDDPVIGDEELFRWMHDPDAGVRQVCYAALTSRGRTDPEIALGRRLTHPDVRERLELLRDLRYDDDVPDPEPWLERLSRDADPAVRAGAARVAVEVAAERRLSVPVWVGRLADADPDPTVRRIARQWRDRPTAGGDDGLRLIGGP
jgi:HEAT repeat protein